MKKFILFISVLSVFSITYAQDLAIATEPDKSVTSSAVLSFTSESYDFGTIKQSVPVSHKFTFTNTGNAPLVINKVSTSCGCAVSEYPKEAIMPNNQAEIVVTYNASNKGAFNKSATVSSNATKENIILQIKGVVE